MQDKSKGELRDEPGHTVPLMQDKSKGELRDEPEK